MRKTSIFFWGSSPIFRIKNHCKIKGLLNGFEKVIKKVIKNVIKTLKKGKCGWYFLSVLYIKIDIFIV